MTILNNAVAKGDLDTVRKLIETDGYSPNYSGPLGFSDTPLTIAAQFGQRKIMEYLIQKGGDINTKSSWFCSSPIEAALKYGHTQVIVSLLVNNVQLPENLHKTDIANALLLKAASANDTWSIDKILSHTEANIHIHDDFMKRTPLHNAVMNDSYDASCKLLELGAKINSIDLHGWTPLHYAASNSDLQFAKLLVEKGAKINSLDNNDRSPLFAAVQMGGEEELVTFLVKNGAKVNQADNEDVTVLDLAVINDDADMIKCLVTNGAKISANTHGDTPLENAAAAGKLQAIEALISLGSSLTHKNTEGKTALELAYKAGEMGAVNTLILHGAEVPKYIQAELDKTKPMDTTDVLPGDVIVTTPAAPTVDVKVDLEVEDKVETLNPTNTTATTETNVMIDTLTVYAQPIGPMLNTPDQNENYFN